MAHRILEFAAHAETVNCVALGQRSGQVVATGGEDAMVHLWRLGSPTCLRSLRGHKTPVTCVKFTNEEEEVIAGAHSGALKVFNVAEGKAVQQLQGHRATATCADVHPFNQIVVSGSLDTNLKLWDLRKKSEFFTFKGHSKVVNCVMFSPDGRWVVSGSDDCHVKLWDLTAGKLMHSFETHSGPITCLDFHPFEFWLASGSDDRSVRLWDLETFGIKCRMPSDAVRIRCVKFLPNGAGIVSATSDAVRILQWSPTPINHTTIDASWGAVADMYISEDYNLIAASAAQSFLTEWGIKLASFAPKLCGVSPSDSPAAPPAPAVVVVPPNAYAAPAAAALAAGGRPPVVAPRYGAKPSAAAAPIFEGTLPGTDIETLAREMAAAQAMPVVPDLSTTQIAEELKAIAAIAAIAPPAPWKPKASPPRNLAPPVIPSVLEMASPPPATADARAKPLVLPGSKFPAAKPPRTSDAGASPASARQERPIPQTAQPASPARIPAPSVPASAPASAVALDDAVESHVIEVKQGRRKGQQRRIPSSSRLVAGNIVPSTRDQPIGLQIDDFIPPEVRLTGKTTSADILDLVDDEHSSFMACLQRRVQSVKVISAMWSHGNLRSAISRMTEMNDVAMQADFLRVVNLRAPAVKLDTCASLLPLIRPLLASGIEDYAMVGLRAAKVLHELFGQYIKETRAALAKRVAGGMVDVAAEERYSRCNEAYEAFQSCEPAIHSLTPLPGMVGRTAKDVHLRMIDL